LIVPDLPLMQIFCWVDIFAISQHPGTAQMDDLDGLKDVIKDAEQTLMVLDPAGVVLTRIWCLFEAWHSSKRGVGHLSILSYGRDLDSMYTVSWKLGKAIRPLGQACLPFLLVLPYGPWPPEIPHPILLLSRCSSTWMSPRPKPQSKKTCIALSRTSSLTWACRL
jgi:hypothetical protein